MTRNILSDMPNIEALITSRRALAVPINTTIGTALYVDVSPEVEKLLSSSSGAPREYVCSLLFGRMFKEVSMYDMAIGKLRKKYLL